MTTFLITSPKGTSEWKNSFVDVQIEMNELERIGVVSNVTVQKFVDMVMVKSVTYNFDGQSWEVVN